MDWDVKKFLKNIRKNFKSDPECKFVIITGNESCDLDSIVSAIGYAFLKTTKEKDGDIYIPYCNVSRDDIDLRTEVVYWLKTVGLLKEDLITAGDLDWLLKKENAKMVELILVDHLQTEQSNSFKNYPVVEIIDHRPLPKDYKQPNTCAFFNVHIVGSCTTLITELLFEHLDPSKIPKNLCHLLYGAILLDNDGFSAFAIEVNKATKRDQLACKKLLEHAGQALLNQDGTQNDVYEALKKAKCDISGLSLQQLFQRDCKKVILPDCPIILCSTITGVDCQKLPYISGFFDDASLFCSQQNAHALVCVTVGRIPNVENSCPNCNPKEAFLDDGTRRGVVITGPPQNLAFANKLWQYLIDYSGALHLRSLKGGECCNTPIHQDVHIAVVTNPCATRKQLMPILNDFLMKECS
ncbi:unnamed protein product [Hymenolepis diminuta]|uniref:DHHA2 domain-containing protein n=1 Tax=Hymenolepis diminuta TaxID=6216 RepID=A0A0R3SWM3_HYMDI|nr:unnamed protein product [Hymenolepis diminuta]VUZ49301.1 unnamed protein product [Hymenolepis diminuta]